MTNRPTLYTSVIEIIWSPSLGWRAKMCVQQAEGWMLIEQYPDRESVMRFRRLDQTVDWALRTLRALGWAGHPSDLTLSPAGGAEPGAILPDDWQAQFAQECQRSGLSFYAPGRGRVNA